MKWFDKDHPPVKLEFTPWEQDPTELIEEERREREKQWWANYEAPDYGGTDDEEF